jgi:large subunit ribosomal protein L5e
MYVLLLPLFESASPRTSSIRISSLQGRNVWVICELRGLILWPISIQVICQIVSPEIIGDKVICAAYSHELPRYGIKHGLTNWAAAYATGLLLARRLLTKLELADSFVGVEEVDGEYTLTEAAEVDDETRRPFKAFLDVGLHRTSTGARVFGAMKGASDGGLLIPHSKSRFPGYDMESKELDAETLRKLVLLCIS